MSCNIRYYAINLNKVFVAPVERTSNLICLILCGWLWHLFFWFEPFSNCHFSEMSMTRIISRWNLCSWPLGRILLSSDSVLSFSISPTTHFVRFFKYDTFVWKLTSRERERETERERKKGTQETIANHFLVVMKPLSTCQKCVNHIPFLLFHSNVKYQFCCCVFVIYKPPQFAWQVKRRHLWTIAVEKQRWEQLECLLRCYCVLHRN